MGSMDVDSQIEAQSHTSVVHFAAAAANAFIGRGFAAGMLSEKINSISFGLVKDGIPSQGT